MRHQPKHRGALRYAQGAVPSSSRGGAALMLALVAILIVGVVGMALTALVMAGTRAVRAAASRDEVLNIAESGAEAAISRLAAGARVEAGESGARVVKVPGGECRVSVVAKGGGRFEITSRASRTRPGGKARSCAVVLVVERTTGGRFRVAEWKLVPGGGG